MKAIIFFILLITSLLFSCTQQIGSKKEFDQQYNKELAHFQPVMVLMNKRPLNTVILSVDSLYKTFNHNSFFQELVYYISKSVIYQNKGDDDLHYLYLDSAISIIEKKHLEKSGAECYSSALLQKASLLVKLHQPEKANEIFFSTQQFSQKHNSITVQFSVAEQLAYIAYRQKNYRQALLSFKETYFLHQIFDQKDFYKKAELLDNIALCFYKMHTSDSSIAYYNKAIVLLELHKSNIAPYIVGVNENKNSAEKSKGVVLGNLALIFKDEGKLDSAITLSKESITINRHRCCEQRNAQLVQMQLIDMYFEKHQWSNMHSELVSLRKGLDSLPNSEPEMNYQRQMAAYYETTHQPEKAFTYLKSFMLIRDSLNNIIQKDVESNIVKDLKLKNQEADLELLKKSNQLNKLYLWFTIVLILIVLGVTFLGFVDYLKGRKNILVLNSLNKTIDKQKADLEYSNLTLQKLFSIIAHDLRSPIGALQYSMSLLNDETISLENFQKLIENLNIQVGALVVNLDNILQWSISQLGGFIAKPLLFDMQPLIEEVIELLKASATAKGISIKLPNIQKNAEVFADRDQLHLIIRNLISNAIKYSFLNSVIEVFVTAENNLIQISVTDYGIGIPEEKLQKLFSDLGSSTTGTAKEKGTGLGLILVKEFIEKNNGTIQCSSKENKGSIFLIKLPKSNTI